MDDPGARFWVGQARLDSAIVLTMLRLPLGLACVSMILLSQPLIASALVVMFVTIDVFDGVVARQFGRESATRRAADALIDKISVHLCALAVIVQLPHAVYFWIPLLARDIIQALYSSRAVHRRRVVVAGAGWHRVFSLSVAFWGIAILIAKDASIAFGVVAILAGAVTLIDYVLQVRVVVSKATDSQLLEIIAS